MNTLADCIRFDSTKRQSCFLQKPYIVPNMGIGVSRDRIFSLSDKENLCFQDAVETHMLVQTFTHWTLEAKTKDHECEASSCYIARLHLKTKKKER